jgi:Ca2+-binding RTX toxin-like protein
MPTRIDVLRARTDTSIFVELFDAMVAFTGGVGSAPIEAIMNDPSKMWLVSNNDGFEGLARASGYSGPTSGVAAHIVGLGPGFYTELLVFPVFDTLAAAAALPAVLQTGTGLPNINFDGTFLYDSDPESPDAQIVEGDVLNSTGFLHIIDNALMLYSYTENNVAPYQANPTPTTGDDNLVGTENDDTVDLLSGNDSFLALGGNDTVLGSIGNDVLIGGEGNDSLVGGIGNDTIDGETGNDTIDGGLDDDWLKGETGDDLMFGGEGNDSMEGGDGNDTMDGQAGNDTIFGGGGDDIISGEENDDLIIGGEGNDSLEGDDGNDTVDGGSGNDTILGGEGNDWLKGEGGDDLMFGGEGNDLMEGGEDNDTMDGGSGNDTLEGDDGNDTINGDAGTDSISGGAGDDSLYASSATTNSGGEDTIDGGEGNDFIMGSNSANLLIGGIGDDTINGGVDWSTSDSDTLDGGEGNDLLISGQTHTPTAATQSNGDLLDGGAGNDTLLGGKADDNLDGGSGNDSMDGGNGDDTFIISNAADAAGDVIVGGNGPDDEADYDVLDLTGAGLVTISATADLTDTGATTGTVTFADSSVLTFSQIEEILTDNPVADDVVDGLETGEFMSPLLFSRDDNIPAYTDAGGDMIMADGPNDIRGNGGNDTIIGGDDGDTIDGGDGDDIINGGFGDDDLTGGVGADIFVFELGSGDDTITDFEDGIDLFDISALQGTGLYSFISTMPSTVITSGEIQTFDDGSTLTFLTVGGVNATLTTDDFIL